MKISAGWSDRPKPGLQQHRPPTPLESRLHADSFPILGPAEAGTPEFLEHRPWSRSPEMFITVDDISRAPYES